MKTLMLTLILTSFVGCNGVNKLLGQNNQTSTQDPEVLGGPQLTVPNFDIPLMTGYKRIKLVGFLDSTGMVQLPENGVLSIVAIKHMDFWFRLGTNYSDAFYYSFDPVENKVTYYGTWKNGLEYCIYEDVPNN